MTWYQQIESYQSENEHNNMLKEILEPIYDTNSFKPKHFASSWSNYCVGLSFLSLDILIKDFDKQLLLVHRTHETELIWLVRKKQRMAGWLE